LYEGKEWFLYDITNNLEVEGDESSRSRRYHLQRKDSNTGLKVSRYLWKREMIDVTPK